MKIELLQEGMKAPFSILGRDGDWNGEWYRRNLIAPALAKLKPGETLEIDFTGLAGANVEAVDEMFGMLVEENDYSEKFLNDTLVFLPEKRYAGLREFAFELIHAAVIEKARAHGAPPF